MFVTYFIAWKFHFELVLFHVATKAQENEGSTLQDVMIVRRKIMNQLKLRQSYSRPACRQEQHIKLKSWDLLLKFSLKTSCLPVSYVRV